MNSQKKIKILFRPSYENDFELEHAKKHFVVEESRINCFNSLVIGRYSCLPFYRELEKDLSVINSKLINNYQEHLYIANFEWYEDLEKYTFKTYFDYNFYQAPDGEYVVKGKTNSRKMKWNKLMYAKSKFEAMNIANELSGDPLIGSQGILYRVYEPLETFEIGLNDLPMTNEFRFFFYKDNLIDYGYYWSIAEIEKKCGSEFIDFAKMIAKIIANKTNFFVLDIAKTQSGELKLVEINDGQMSGLSCIKPDNFYKNLGKLTRGIV